MQLDFGYLPLRINAQGERWSISTLPGLDDVVSAISDSTNVQRGWFYPGSRLRTLAGSDTISTDPFPARLFNLPKTHVIDCPRAASVDQANFIIWVLSFFFGIRLTSTQNGFLDSATTSIGSLVDFIFRGSVESAVTLAESFWSGNVHDPAQAKRFAAAVHALFMAQGPQLLQFERFIYHYTALDACFALLWNGKGCIGSKPTHAKRTAWMCIQTGVPVPSWATVGSDGSTEVSGLRNDAMHEALFSGEPFGFALIENSFERNLPLEMKNLTCRLLAAIIGVPDRGYIEMPTDIYSHHGMHISPAEPSLESFQS